MTRNLGPYKDVGSHFACHVPTLDVIRMSCWTRKWECRAQRELGKQLTHT
jgi:hypothetical protein